MSKTAQKESLLPPLWILTLLFCYGLIRLVTELKELIVLLAIGYAVAYVIDPVLDRLERIKISRGVGFIIVFGAIIVGMFLITLTAIPPLVEDFNHFADSLPGYTEQVRARFAEWLESLRPYLPAGTSLDEMKEHLATVPSVSGDTLKGLVAGLFAFLLRGYSITLFLVNLALLPFIVYYLAIDLDRFHRWVFNLIPRSNRRRWERIFHEIDTYTSAFVIGQSTVCILLFFLYSFGFWLAGLKQWLLLACIAGFGNIVPYLGTITGLLLSTLLALVTFGDFSHVVYTWLVFAVVQFLEGVVITPKIVGDKVGLPPLLVILAIVAGGKLLGLLGVFLAIPLAAMLRVLLGHGYQQLLKRIDQ